MTGAELPSTGKRTSTSKAAEPPAKKARTVEQKPLDAFFKPSTSTSSPAKPKTDDTVTKNDLGLTSFSSHTFLNSLSTTGAAPTVRQLLELESTTLDSSWLALLQKEIQKNYFLDLKRFLLSDMKSNKIFPPARDIYSWSRYCPLDKVKVVIIGQDPYHDDGQAHGLCFSVRPGVAVPPSLRNIYKELATEYTDFVPPKTGDLIPWARSGVLLLNTSLTVRAHQAGSHSNKGWETFTDKVIDLVDKYGGSDGVGKLGKGVVFLAWGAWAAKRVAKLDQKKHLILKSAHPSPLSAHRGFLGNGHFKNANEWLEKKYGENGKIDWTSVCRPQASVAAQISSPSTGGKSSSKA